MNRNVKFVLTYLSLIILLPLASIFWLVTLPLAFFLEIRDYRRNK